MSVQVISDEPRRFAVTIEISHEEALELERTMQKHRLMREVGITGPARADEIVAERVYAELRSFADVIQRVVAIGEEASSARRRSAESEHEDFVRDSAEWNERIERAMEPLDQLAREGDDAS